LKGRCRLIPMVPPHERSKTLARRRIYVAEPRQSQGRANRIASSNLRVSPFSFVAPAIRLGQSPTKSKKAQQTLTAYYSRTLARTSPRAHASMIGTNTPRTTTPRPQSKSTSKIGLHLSIASGCFLQIGRRRRVFSRGAAIIRQWHFRSASSDAQSSLPIRAMERPSAVQRIAAQMHRHAQFRKHRSLGRQSLACNLR